MKKLLTITLAAAFLAVSLIPAFAAEKPSTTKAPAAKMTKSAKPAMSSTTMKSIKTAKTMKMATGNKMTKSAKMAKCTCKKGSKTCSVHKSKKMVKKMAKPATKK